MQRRFRCIDIHMVKALPRRKVAAPPRRTSSSPPPSYPNPNPRTRIPSDATTNFPIRKPDTSHTTKMAHLPTPQIRSLYRRLLRELPSTPQTTKTQHQKLSTPSAIQQRIRTHLSMPREASKGSSAQSQIQQAEQFVQYVQAQRTYATLLERYNPGMGMTEEERVRLSARRVGMNLPVEYGEGDGK